MAVEGASNVQSQSHSVAGTPDAAAATPVDRVANGFLTSQTPSGPLLADNTHHAGSPAPRPGDIPAWKLAQDDGAATGGATAAKPSPATAPASAPIELPFNHGVLDKAAFVASLDRQLDHNQGASVVDKNWSRASVQEVRRTYNTLGEAIGEQADGKGVKILFTDMVLPADQKLLAKVVLRVGGPRQEDMIDLMHKVDPTTFAVRDDVLVQSNDYQKLEAYVACLGKAMDGGIEVKALNPGETPKPDVGQYIVLGSGTRADVSASTRVQARLLTEVTDTKLTPAVRARNLAKILDPSATPDILARALRNFSRPEIDALQSAMEKLPPKSVRAVATALDPAICQIEGRKGYDLASAFVIGITTADKRVSPSNPDGLAIAGALSRVSKHLIKNTP